MRRRFALALALGAAVLTVAAVLYVYLGVRDRQGSGVGGFVLFEIESGESFGSVRDRLHEAGLLRRPRALALYAVVRGLDRRVQAGLYRLGYDERPIDIMGKFVGGDVYTVDVTIPEGFTQREIARTFGAQAGIDSTAFTALSADTEFVRELGVGGRLLEGYLFPDTYAVPWGAPARNVVAVMVGRLNEVFSDSLVARAREIGMTHHQVLTLASIIQAEARVAEELAKVSAVYHNRLRVGMRLEADPTVAYAMGGYKGRLLYRDLDVDSPYNTYKNGGLPPGPICSPGRAAIFAALFPDTSCDALYFVARGDGGHIFSRTLEEHLVAVRSVREQKKGAE